MTNNNNMGIKQGLTNEQLMMVNSEVERRGKSKTTAYWIWFFFGGMGGHRFYMGDTGYALGMFFTLGGLGLWTLIDVFLIGKRMEEKTLKLEREIITEAQLLAR